MLDGDAVAVAFDARMGEVYWACYICKDGQPELMGHEQVCAPASVALADGASRWFGAGQGWNLKENFPDGVAATMQHLDETLVPRASRVAEIAARDFRAGAGVPAEQAQPVYIRDEVAWKKLPGR